MGGKITMDNRNIVLTGFMGTGKTAAGRRVAHQVGRPFVDMDALIEQPHPVNVGALRYRCNVAARLQRPSGLCNIKF